MTTVTYYQSSINDYEDSYEIRPEITIETNVESPKTKGTMLSTFFNLTNTTIGAGALTLPLALRKCGLLFGIFLLLASSALSMYTCDCILDACERNKKFTNREIYKKLGKYDVLVEWLYFTLCFGVLCMYANIICISLETLLLNWIGIESFVSKKEFIAFFILVFIVIPLCLSKNISILGFISSFSVIGILFITIIIIVKFIGKTNTTGIQINHLELFKFDFKSIGSFLFSFICQHSIVSNYRELKKRSNLKMKSIIFSSYFSSTVIYIICAVLGYFLFLERSVENLKGNILENFESDILISIAKISIIMVILLSFPVLHYTARESLLNLVPTKTIPWASEISTILLCGFSFMIGVGITDVILLMDISVSISGVLGCFCLPLVISFVETKKIWRKVLNAILILISLGISMVLTVLTTFELYEFFKDINKKK
jgi:amino acid permease